MGRASRSPRRVFREAKHREQEARKLLRRGRRSIDPAIQDEIRQVLDSLRSTRKARDLKGCKEALKALDPLADSHLARYRKSAFREYSESIGLAVLFALTLRAFVVEAFQIPSESMVPTLLVGDHLFVNKFVYGVRIPFTRFDIIDFGDPEPGDVVVFIYPVEEVRTQHTLREVLSRLESRRAERPDRSYPESLAEVGMAEASDAWENRFRYQPDGEGAMLASAGPDGTFDTPDDITERNTALRRLGPHQRDCITRENLEEAKDYIKRVVGVAGDRIRVENNTVFINDVRIASRAAESGPEAHRDRFGRQPIRRIETLGDADFIVQYYGSIADFDEITVREGYIFVMGDNRDNSSDSRCWGQVPVENVKGEAMFLFWSGGDGGGFLGNRWGRMLHSVE